MDIYNKILEIIHTNDAVVFKELWQSPEIRAKVIDSALIEAADKGSLDIIEILLNDPNFRSKKAANILGQALRVASRKSNIAMVNRLLKEPEARNSLKDNIALEFAAAAGRNEVVERLLKEPITLENYLNSIQSILEWTARKGDVTIFEIFYRRKKVREYLDNNLVKTRRIFHLAVINAQLPILEVLLQLPEIRISLKDKGEDNFEILHHVIDNSNKSIENLIMSFRVITVCEGLQLKIPSIQIKDKTAAAEFVRECHELEQKNANNLQIKNFPNHWVDKVLKYVPKEEIHSDPKNENVIINSIEPSIPLPRFENNPAFSPLSDGFLSQP